MDNVESKTILPGRLGGSEITSQCSRDKSLTHRAIIFTALASGKSQISKPLLGADCLSTIDCFRQLGVKFAVTPETIVVDSPGAEGFKSPEKPLDCGNSGTTARLLLGLFAALEGLEVTLMGDESLSSRPMDRVTSLLDKVGACYESQSPGSKYLPIAVKGRTLTADHHHIDKATAQVKSAILLSALFTPGQVRVSLPAGSRDHTEKILAEMNLPVTISQQDNLETVGFRGPVTIPPQNFAIPVDPSSAAFFAVLGVLRKAGRTVIPEVLANRTRTGFIEVLKRMAPKSIRTHVVESAIDFVEPAVTLETEGGEPLLATQISASEIPTLVDEIPVLAVAAAFAQGKSLFAGLSELRIKECDRLAKTYELLTRAGCDCEIKGDDLFIAGGLTTAKAFSFDSAHDHRLAMAAAVLANFADGPCEIINHQCVKISFPDFFQQLAKFDSKSISQQ